MNPQPKPKDLIFSGLATKEEKERALSLGASGYLNKPVQIDALLQEIEEIERL